MSTYSYTTVNPAGKFSKGTIQAETVEKATEELKRGGLMVASISETGALGKDIELSFLEAKPKPRDMSVFCRQFVSIISAGVSVIAALEMLGEQTENKRLKKAIQNCKTSIEKGESLASAMRENRNVFSDIFVTMVEAGEASGSLEISFTRMAEQFEKDSKLKATVKKASVYPVVVLVVALGVIIVMLAMVIPTFEDMFEDLGTELPAITQAVVAASDFIQNCWYVLVAAVIGVAVLFRFFKTTPTGKRVFGFLGMKLPLIGNLTVKTAAARMARTLSTLLSAGIPMIDALEITSDVMSNVYFHEALMDVRDEVAMGSSIAEPLKNTKVFPPLVHHMIGIGEETGDIDGMLTKLADYFEEEVEQATAQVMAALEPMIIVLLAGIIGTIVIAVLSPMASMYTALDSM